MSLEFVVVTVVLGNLACAVLGWIAGRAMGGALELDVQALQDGADRATIKLKEARQSAQDGRSELERAAASSNPENELERILNEDRRNE